MLNLHQEYCTEKLDENGVLVDFQIHCPDNFNFAYDVVDRIASQEPDRRAMMCVMWKGKRKCSLLVN